MIAGVRTRALGLRAFVSEKQSVTGLRVGFYDDLLMTGIFLSIAVSGCDLFVGNHRARQLRCVVLPDKGNQPKISRLFKTIDMSTSLGTQFTSKS